MAGDRASVLRRRRVVMLWGALVCLVVGAVVGALTAGGSAPFQVAAVLIGVGVGLPVALGTGLLVESAGRALRRPGRSRTPRRAEARHRRPGRQGPP